MCGHGSREQERRERALFCFFVRSRALSFPWGFSLCPSFASLPALLPRGSTEACVLLSCAERGAESASAEESGEGEFVCSRSRDFFFYLATSSLCFFRSLYPPPLSLSSPFALLCSCHAHTRAHTHTTRIVFLPSIKTKTEMYSFAAGLISLCLSLSLSVSLSLCISPSLTFSANFYFRCGAAFSMN